MTYSCNVWLCPEALEGLCPVCVLYVSCMCFAQLRRQDAGFPLSASALCFTRPSKGKVLSKQGLSQWSVQTVGMAYRMMGRTSPLAVRAHSTQGMATSSAFSRGVSVSDICAATRWATPHTLMVYYRLDMTVPSPVQGIVSVGYTE